MNTLIRSLILMLASAPAAYAIEDIEIITQKDQKFCKADLKNSDVKPTDLEDDGSVWRAGNRRWDENYEAQFAAWVKTEVKENFFEEYRIGTDCADAAIAIRVIFSRIHHLPVVLAGGRFKHTDKKHGGIPTILNWNPSNWKKALKADRRFRAALTEWQIGVATVNINLDTYPLRVRSQLDSTRLASCIRPGAVLLSEGHTRFVAEIDSMRWNPVKQLASTTPIEIRPLSRSDLDLTVAKDTKEYPGRGILSWNWPVNCQGKFVQVPDSKMPNYSSEQFDFDSIYKNTNLSEIVQSLARARALNHPRAEDIQSMISDLKRKFEERITAVNAGWAAYQANPASFKDRNGAAFDGHSTPHRDEGLSEFYDLIASLVARNQEPLKMTPKDLMTQVSKIYLEVVPRKSYRLNHLLFALNNGGFSSDPTQPLEKRWGLQKIEDFKRRLLERKMELMRKVSDAIEMHHEQEAKVEKLQGEFSKQIGRALKVMGVGDASQNPLVLYIGQLMVKNQTPKALELQAEKENLERLASDSKDLATRYETLLVEIETFF